LLRQLADILQAVLAKFDGVAVLQEMLLDGLPIDERAVGAAQILKKGIIEYGNHHRVLTRDRQIVDLDIVVRLAADRGALLVQGNFLEHRGFHAEYELSHCFRPSRSHHLNQASKRDHQPRFAG
jgi:hypothetical protein